MHSARSPNWASEDDPAAVLLPGHRRGAHALLHFVFPFMENSLAQFCTSFCGGVPLSGAFCPFQLAWLAVGSATFLLLLLLLFLGMFFLLTILRIRQDRSVFLEQLLYRVVL